MTGSTREFDRDIEDMLPFFANGRLSVADRARVEAALASQPELARRLALIEEERAEAIALNEALGAPSPHALDKLMAKIEAEPMRAAHLVGAVQRGLFDRLGGMLAALSPRTLAYAGAAALAIIALQGAVLTGVMSGRGPAYETASAPLARGTYVLASFAPEASTTQLAKALAEAGATIVEGPRASGLYRLKLSDTVLGREELARRLAVLKNARGVVSSADAEQ